MVAMNGSLGRKKPKGESTGEVAEDGEGEKPKRRKRRYVIIGRAQRSKRKFLTLVTGDSYCVFNLFK